MKKKYLVFAVVLLLAITLTIGGIIAYFTDTHTVTNVFTIGNVQISLTEPNWDADNGQNLVPGENITKDPTITNTGANDAYLFVKVEVPCVQDNSTSPATNVDVFTLNTINTLSWNKISDTVSNNVHTYVYAYATGTGRSDLTIFPAANVANNTAAGQVTLFNSVTFTTNSTFINEMKEVIADELNSGHENPLRIKVTAYAIQTTSVTGTTQEEVYELF